ncbi:hypothetical protein ACVOZ6_003451 [Escherichia coli]
MKTFTKTLIAAVVALTSVSSFAGVEVSAQQAERDGHASRYSSSMDMNEQSAHNKAISHQAGFAAQAEAMAAARATTTMKGITNAAGMTGNNVAAAAAPAAAQATAPAAAAPSAPSAPTAAPESKPAAPESKPAVATDAKNAPNTINVDSSTLGNKPVSVDGKTVAASDLPAGTQVAVSFDSTFHPAPKGGRNESNHASGRAGHDGRGSDNAHSHAFGGHGYGHDNSRSEGFGGHSHFH